MTRALGSSTSSGVLVHVLLSVARENGLDVNELLRAVELDPTHLENASGRIPRVVEHRLWSVLARQTGDDAFGLHLAENLASSGRFGPLEYLIRACATLRLACDQVARFLPVLFDGDEIRYDIIGEHVAFGYRRGAQGPPLTRHPEECAVASFVLLVRSMLGADWAPDRVLFEHVTPAFVAEHQRIFRSPVSFGERLNGIVFAARWLDHPSASGDPALLGILQDYAASVLDALPDEPPLTRELGRLIAEELPKGGITLKQAARRLHMSVRSLQRRLDAEGKNFSVLVEEVRISCALRHFERGSRTVGEVAYLVGFSDQNAFSRAFKRSTGKAPSDVLEPLRARKRELSGAARDISAERSTSSRPALPFGMDSEKNGSFGRRSR